MAHTWAVGMGSKHSGEKVHEGVTQQHADGQSHQAHQNKLGSTGELEEQREENHPCVRVGVYMRVSVCVCVCVCLCVCVSM